MSSISSKIAFPIIITGLFIIVVFMASTYQTLDSNFYIVLIPLTAFLFLFGFAIGQKLATPVKNLLKDVDYLSKGNLKVRFSPEGQDELGQLARAFNKVAEEFEKSNSEIKTLDTKIKLRTKTLEEIISILEQKIKNRTLEFQNAVDDLEITQVQLKSKDTEIADLKNQIVGLSTKKSRKK